MNSTNRQAASPILCIEDNAAFVLILSTLIKGRYLISAGTLAEGLTRLRTTRVSAVLLDMVLPDSDLEQTIHAIPLIRDMVGPDVPIVVLSGYSVAEYNVLGLGASAVVEKGQPDMADAILSGLT